MPQDVKGLITLLGGEKSFITRLDSFFIAEPAVKDAHALVDITGTIGQYAHGNEPSHHITYLYAYAGQQWKTAEKTRYIMKEMYHDIPDGIIGNEDCGQMSAWYILASAGLHPVCPPRRRSRAPAGGGGGLLHVPVFPASGTYVLGSPLFDKATINLAKGKKFTVQTMNNNAGNIYIQSMILNGKPYSNSYILHEDIMKGGELKITMGSKPNMNFGKLPINRP